MERPQWKRPGETRLQAAQRAAADPLGRHVKLADVTDNMDLSRIPALTPKDLVRQEQYAQVRAILLAAIEEERDGYLPDELAIG